MHRPSKAVGLPLLRFLWKWKVATTAALAIKFFPKAKPETAYRRLYELSESGYIQSISSSTGIGFVWTLTSKGFEKILDGLGEVRQVGYKSEALGHDLLSMAAMLGEWLQEIPDGVEFYSEQELRRYNYYSYPMWVPQSDIHRADGYWKLPNLKEGHSIAFELERMLKLPKRYEQVADFYQDYDFVDAVIWISPCSEKKNTIENKLKSYLGDGSEKHWFVSIQDFTRNGWQARFLNGKHRGKTLSDFFGTSLSHAHPKCASTLILETRKKPLILDPSNVTDTHSFFD